MGKCTVCPRRCGAEREQGQKGYCGCKETLLVARAALHMWEEPCISGTAGSGAVFFSGCPLHCIYCQNHDISDGRAGIAITTQRLSEIFLELQAAGAANINLVTAGQYLPQVCEALIRAKENGLHIPIVYNTSGYETMEAIDSLAGLVDVYLPDLKYTTPALAAAFSKAPDYPEIAKAAIARMAEQVGEPQYDENGYITRGVIVRNLVLPGHVKESLAILAYLKETYQDRIYISLMSQYTPPENPLPYPELNRRLTVREYEKAVNGAIALGLNQVFIQEGDTAKESFIPAFDGKGVQKIEK